MIDDIINDEMKPIFFQFARVRFLIWPSSRTVMFLEEFLFFFLKDNVSGRVVFTEICNCTMYFIDFF